ncbi:fimbrial major subunit CsuA/B family protein [Rhizobium leguminosarum]|uniref:Fimbrial major subunit CsuA/B family protein n=1 Tax=Rhizobium ruizarguesonis TaxID=2081791 RepID=A0AAE5C492_9HYPH|nr:spore coat protein U domain-containing protein [Rhizobium ruizarguesonis]NEI52423.1 fimbrial major subunit CsuA/B family protein [Rhizobium ruizarguesonis]
MLRAISLLLFLLLPTFSFANSCSFSTFNMNFGAVDTLSGNRVNSTAAITVNCTGSPRQRILLCPNLGAGSGGASSAAARQMLSGSNPLNYQLYTDSARTVIWGSSTRADTTRSPAYALTLSPFGTGSRTITVYGTVLGNQTAVAVGTYLSSFSGSHTTFRYTTGTSCSSPAEIAAPTSFSVNANVAANCLVGVENIDFGTKGVLSANADAYGSVTATCTPGTTYTISLNGGTTNSAPSARKMSRGSEAVTYGLYKDVSRTQPWGGATTVAGTGNGATQVFTVYGRVLSQPTPSPGTYTDTVVVTLTY